MARSRLLSPQNFAESPSGMGRERSPFVGVSSYGADYVSTNFQRATPTKKEDNIKINESADKFNSKSTSQLDYVKVANFSPVKSCRPTAQQLVAKKSTSSTYETTYSKELPGFTPTSRVKCVAPTGEMSTIVNKDQSPYTTTYRNDMQNWESPKRSPQKQRETQKVGSNAKFTTITESQDNFRLHTAAPRPCPASLLPANLVVEVPCGAHCHVGSNHVH